MKFLKKKKRGSASFYVVAFSTLILVVIAASFISIVLSGLTRTENDELSQSAYDAALAGVEDAKVAFLNYQKCLNGSTRVGGIDCGKIKEWVSEQNCFMVGRILGRIGENDSEEVLIEERTTTGGVGNNMQQAYTCATFKTVLSNYSYTLTQNETTKVVKVKVGGGKSANDVGKVKISWGKASESNLKEKSNFDDSKKIGFPTKENSTLPPVISVGLIQTARTFSLSDFEKTENGKRTNRGTVYLVPTNEPEIARTSNDDNGGYLGTCKNNDDKCGKAIVEAGQIVKTNDHGVKNKSFAVYCLSDGEPSCSVTLELPEVIGGGERSDETFAFVISSPYGISTEFEMEFLTASEETVELDGMQVEVDSTGRANNLFRRVKAVLESSEVSAFPSYGLELLKDSDSNTAESLLLKPNRVTSEHGI